MQKGKSAGNEGDVDDCMSASQRTGGGCKREERQKTDKSTWCAISRKWWAAWLSWRVLNLSLLLYICIFIDREGVTHSAQLIAIKHPNSPKKKKGSKQLVLDKWATIRTRPAGIQMKHDTLTKPKKNPTWVAVYFYRIVENISYHI